MTSTRSVPPRPHVLGRAHGVVASGFTPMTPEEPDRKKRKLARDCLHNVVTLNAMSQGNVVAPIFAEKMMLHVVPPLSSSLIQIKKLSVTKCLNPFPNARGMSPLPRRSIKRRAAVGRNANMTTEPQSSVTKHVRQASFTASSPEGAALPQQSMVPVLNHSIQCFPRKRVSPPQKLGLGIHPLTRCVSKWIECGAHPWVVDTVQKGYKLQFSAEPPTFEKIIFSQASGQAAVILRDEILSLLAKNAIREVPPDQSLNGFYSRYFLVKKKGGGMRPILDLRALNRYLKVFRFKMLTNAALLRMIRRGDWFTSVDLKDAFFHVPIYPPHRKFLRFGFGGRVYEYLVLPFGMSLSPRVFVKCTQAAIAPLRQRGVRIASYIDDWILLAQSESEARLHTGWVVSHLQSLGFSLNYEKSVLIPARSADFIGITLNSTSLTAQLTQDRVDSILKCAGSFQVGRRVPFRMCQKMAGLMASAITVLRLGRLYMRPFQRWMLSLKVPNSRRHRPITVQKECVSALQPWRDRSFLTEGVSMGLVVSRKIITTDASLTGWGATHEGRTARGVWSDELRSAHINYLELMAVWLAVRHFEPFIRDCHVLIRTDNTTTMCYVNKQGGLRSQLLHALARDLILWCDTHLKSIRASHVPGIQNRGADLLSRGRCHYADWSIHDAVAAQLWDRFGRPQVDPFASEENAKCPEFFSITGPGSLGLDALAHVWPRGLLYAFPPISLISPVLERVRTQGLSVLLIAPAWGSWRSEITPLLYDRPWQLPLRRDLLAQAKGEIFHPRPGDLDLWAWPVRG